MKHQPIAILVLSAVLTTACTSSPQVPASAMIRRVIAFQHADARLAVNRARAEFGAPHMDSIVEVRCEPGSNSWVVVATESDMKRVEALAAKLDHD